MGLAPSSPGGNHDPEASGTSEASVPVFACDAMLGGLARWLRAAGYDASWHPGIPDRDLVHLARSESRFLLSADNDIFAFGLVRDGEIPALQVPRDRGPED